MNTYRIYEGVECAGEINAASGTEAVTTWVLQNYPNAPRVLTGFAADGSAHATYCEDRMMREVLSAFAYRV